MKKKKLEKLMRKIHTLPYTTTDFMLDDNGWHWAKTGNIRDWKGPFKTFSKALKAATKE